MENDETERTEMEVGVRGGLYNVSNVEGMAKITPKTLCFTDHPTQDKIVVSGNNSCLNELLHGLRIVKSLA